MIDLKRILVPIDFSIHSRHALMYGAEFARRFSAELFLLNAFEDTSFFQPEAVNLSPSVVPPLEELAAGVKQHLARVAQEGKLADVAHQLDVREGNPVDVIVDFAKDKDIDLIVMGTHGRGWLAHVLLGSTTEKVVRKAPCPVLTVRPAEHEFVKP